MNDPSSVTLAELSQRRGVPLVDALKAAMALGLTKTPTQPLTAEDADLVEKLLRLDRS